MTEASPAAVPRRIVALVERESDTSIIVGLDCGHRRHVRHRPPLSSFGWALSDASVHAKMGETIECLRCAQRLLPDGATSYRSTATFDEHSVPKGLRNDHTTKDGVWGRLVVEEGVVEIVFAPPLSSTAVGRPGTPIMIPPQLSHHVRLCGPVRFVVEFLRPPPHDS